MSDLHRVLVSFTKAASDRDSRRAGRGNGVVLTATAAADPDDRLHGQLPSPIAACNTSLPLHIVRSISSRHTPCELIQRRAPQRARLFVGKAESYSRVTMNIIASSETIAVRLQKTCILSPGHYSGAAAARSPV
jgi:hypothetical protein